jgi:hypothetical protein
MPRRSAASLSVIPLAREIRTIPPPNRLSPAQSEIFRAIVGSKPAGYFQPGDLPAIEALAQHLERRQRIEAALSEVQPTAPEFDGLARATDRETRVSLALMRALRLTPQARYRPENDAVHSPGRGDPVARLLALEDKHEA